MYKVLCNNYHKKYKFDIHYTIKIHDYCHDIDFLINLIQNWSQVYRKDVSNFILSKYIEITTDISYIRELNIIHS